jgi:UDP-N-acetylmuramate--alanine ligase
LIVVDVPSQSLALLEQGEVVFERPVSTATAGVGGQEGSHRTPPGWHRIRARIGGGDPVGTEYKSREPTGRVWAGEPLDDDLILTRILTLEGNEPGINQGPGCDSLERYIYIHGTNHEDAIGTPASHGCIRMRNADVIDLFERVREGDPLVVMAGEPPSIPDPRGPGSFHYAGIAGSGMSALAQFQAMLGASVSGSDRSFDRGERGDERAKLERLGIRIVPQDGRGLPEHCPAMVVSTAVEDQVPDVVTAKRRGIRIVHRSELLEYFVRTFRTLAITGTSGKSTVVGMTFEILLGAARAPSVITGGDLRLLQADGLWGNAYYGGSDLLVVEADESDGSVVRYHPAVGVVLNLQRDHHEPAKVLGWFEQFRLQAREAFVVGEDEALESLREGATVFGLGPGADVRAVGIEIGEDGSRFEVEDTTFRLPVPGRHNVVNALAAIAACREIGVPLSAMVEPLAAYHGVGRRFQLIGKARGVQVVDDFAHNGAKIEAALVTAQRRSRRVIAVYQPHGFAPTRFLRADFVDVFSRTLGPEDHLWMLEVFYAGGTTTKDFSSADIVEEIRGRGANASFAPSREGLIQSIRKEARDGDLVLVMGARDPSLTALARAILDAIGSGSNVAAAPAPRT